MAIENATGILSAEHAAGLECALKAQKYMYKEYDAIQQGEKAVYREAWNEHEQLQVWYRLAAGKFAAEQAEIAAQRAKLESSAANQATQRDFDNQHFADAVEK